MAQWLQMDPVKRDYVVVNGSPVPSDRIYEAAYFALLIPKNAWLYGTTNQGSLLYTLEDVKRTPSIEQEYAGYVQDALQAQLISAGLATQSQVNNLEATRTGTNNSIQIQPAATPVQSQLTFLPV